ncbi:XRE family transcriptional regulator [Moraxella sp. Pampa]|uniref:XRE family transcriptional regulator n=1 Tax=Moraxella sp. Pampa TaxID=3111978 RepID=UPI002B41560C|nr:S24 family peptidase [Moraxella sp. Pampa]
MELKDRLKYARKQTDLTQANVAKAVGITQASYSELERGLVKSSGKIVEIAKVLKVNPSWLATGEEEMNASVLVTNISPNFEPVSDWDGSTPLDDDEVAVPFYKDFGVACGHGADGVALENEWRRLRMSRATIDRIGSHHDQIFATLADGDSMSPTINDGDTIWVDMSKETIKDGKIFVFEYGGLFMCKRLYRLPNNGLRVVSDNADTYPDWQITGEQREQNGFNLIGWVWHWSVMERW